TTNLGDSINISFNYADLWTNELLLSIYDWLGNTIAVDLSQYDNKFKLNSSEFTKYEQKINITDYEDYDEFGNIREIGITLPDTEIKKIIKIDNLKISSNLENTDFNLNRSFDFNLPDGSSPNEIVIEPQPEWEPYFESENKINKLMLHGLTDQNVEELVPLAKSWSAPAEIEVKGNNLKNLGYDPEQMAYILELNELKDNSVIEFIINGSKDSPLHNPAIVLKNFNAKSFELIIDGNTLIEGKNYRYGIENSLEGDYLILWNILESNEPVLFNIKS
ncbi:MAG: hypothetical protein R3250_09645, partial [Melioribacteraceae bacterium]|nr:hypothetical protein [Melioribacteraceae bacterium]